MASIYLNTRSPLRVPMIKKVLQQIGLTDSEIKVYLGLLNIGESTRNSIVHESGIAGSKIYDILDKLQKKGLVSVYTQNKIKHFKATNPTQIKHYLEEKKDTLSLLEKSAEEILPELLAKFNASKEEQEVQLLFGMKGLQTIFYEQIDDLEKGEYNYVIGGTDGNAEDRTVVTFFEKIHTMRAQKGILTKLMYNERNEKETETKPLKHTAPVAINIWKNKTAILIFGKQITAIYISSQDVANSFKEYFDLLWEQENT